MRLFLIIPLFFFLIGCNSDSAEKETSTQIESNQPENVSEKGKIIFFGNSITAAYKLDPKDGFSNLIQQKIDSLGLPYECINAGNSGETSAGGLNRLDWVLKNGCDVFVLELGANDGLRGLPLENTEKNLNEILNKVKTKYPECKLVLAGMKVPPSMGGDYALKYDEMFTRLGSREDVAFIPFILEGVAGIPELNLEDGIHPTAEGHKILAKNVWKTLKGQL
jgi:acyl-CoA thioesterase I